MKILQVTETYGPEGGVGNYVQSVAVLLQQHGHQNTVVCRRLHPNAVVPPGQHVYCVAGAKDTAATLQMIDCVVRTERPEVAYVHAVHDPSVVAYVAGMVPTVGYIHGFYPVCPGLAKLLHRGDRICRRPFGLGCIPMIYFRRCSDARRPRTVSRIMHRTAASKAVYQSLPRVAVASRYMRGLLVQNGFDEGRIAILPPHFATVCGSGDASGRGGQILFAGRLEAEKGFPYLLRAASLIHSPWRLLVAGDGTLRPQYEQLARRLGIVDRVDFLGWLSGDELGECYQRCSLVAMPSTCPEAFGKVGVEALSNATPVVAFDVGGISDWLKSGWNGFLVKPRDVGAMAARIEQLLCSPSQRREFGMNGREQIRREYSPGRHLEQLLGIFGGATEARAQ